MFAGRRIEPNAGLYVPSTIIPVTCLFRFSFRRFNSPNNSAISSSFFFTRSARSERSALRAASESLKSFAMLSNFLSTSPILRVFSAIRSFNLAMESFKSSRRLKMLSPSSLRSALISTFTPLRSARKRAISKSV